MQKSAVMAPLGNCLILAGAGSGKTRVLVSRIAWLVQEYSINPHDVLAVTFTNKAAGEMKERLSTLLDMSLSGFWVGTFHGLCHRILRRHHQDAKLPEFFHILDSEDQARLIKRALAALNLNEEQWPVKQAQSFINSQKDEGIRPQHVNVPQYGSVSTLVQIYKVYEQACQTAGVIDFAELLLKTLELFRDNQEILNHYQRRFKAILVDEFQDTNAVQYAWIKLLAGQNAAVLAVGDDDQSIYGWRGAKVENIQQFSQDFHNTQVIRLEQNYRSTVTILDAANALISNNSTRMGKKLWTAGNPGQKIMVYEAYNDLDEARWVRERIEIAINQGHRPDDVAVLYRSNAQSRVFEETLLRAGIAYRIHGGLRFYERAEIKDTLAYLRIIANVNDDPAFERIVNFPTRGIGEKTLDEIRQLAKTNHLSMWQASINLLNEQQLPQRAAASLEKFIQLITQLNVETHLLDLDEQISEIINKSGLYAHFAKVKGDKSESRLDNLQELINAAKQFRYEQDIEVGQSMLHIFLAHAALESGEMQAANHEHYVHLMTLHAAKGLEFPLVFMVGMEEGVFPSKQSVEEPRRLEEERRLCYVGMTRAMQQLTISSAEVRRQYGREEFHRPSRFIAELPQSLLEKIRVKTQFHSPTHQKSIPATAAQDVGLTLGQSVNHPKFGEGIVLSVEGSGAHTRVQVKFADHGVKWLVLAYANLEKCSS